MRSLKRSGLAGAAVLLAASAALAGCADDSENDGGGSAGGTAPGDGKAECEGMTEWGDLTGRDVTVYTSIVAPEDQPHIDSWKVFEDCTGADVKYEGSKEFEAQLQVRVQAGNPPDIAYIPQPGLLQTLVGTGKVVEAPEGVSENVDEFFGEDWKGYGSVDDTFYAAPLGANVKSFVWYSPKMFADNGWEIPETWDDMMALTEEIAQAGDIKPWCAGIESGEATGWPATDWLEDVLLRTGGPDVYDQWVNHEIPFNDDAVVEGLDTVGEILKNEDYVNGGIGDVKSIATTPFQEGGLPILDGECALHRMASFYAANWPEGTDVSQNGDAFAFYLPPIGDEFGSPVLGGGEFVAAFSDAPEVQAFQTFLSSDTWANEKAKATPGGGWVSANTGLEISNLSSPIDQLSAEIFQDPDAVFRFDGSDQMPGAVGAGSFWTEMTAWIAQGQSTEDSLTKIEESWED
ncbi:ABC transporter substrate-binding protein [Nocardioides deserti]|uniref:Carbohydrate ABC transporter substrate-binding protein n=1 Tax=Nocardioides deserti TaxID=1588644 RepID=A0ABR6U8U8_9ACTN|nr:ABC transporter substrate-binding protein [Nocardioides deserti]MBC2960354.1 carbohydrate ABC transporter substrate-binding protein [Nocardioides deserti]GGO71641.1 alpha-glucoside ABC transporter substrate-binding protein [Nocardioides deserti]